LEALIEPFANEVQLGAVEVGQALGIDDHLDAMTLEDQVFRGQLVDELQHVGETGAASRTHPQTDTFTLAAPLDGTLHVTDGGFRHADGSCRYLFVRARRAVPSSACSRGRPR